MIRRRPRKNESGTVAECISCAAEALYIYDADEQRARKLTHYLHFPGAWPLRDCMCDLKAVMLHRGRDVQSGHYWCCVQTGSECNSRWITYNDSCYRDAVPGEPQRSKDDVGDGCCFMNVDNPE